MALLERYDAVLAALPAALRACYGDRLVAAAVFGSVGRGTPHDGSDVDLLVVATDLPIGRMRRMEEFDAVERHMRDPLAAVSSRAPGVELSPVFKRPAELEAGTPLLLDMVEDARLLVDKGGVLAARLERLRRRLEELPRAAAISARLRKERELSFHGDIDFVPTEQYVAEDAARAYDDAAWIVELARRAIESGS